MSQQRNYVTLGELVMFIFILMFAILALSFISWKDTHELQRRVGTLEVQFQQLEQRR